MANFYYWRVINGVTNHSHARSLPLKHKQHQPPEQTSGDSSPNQCLLLDTATHFATFKPEKVKTFFKWIAALTSLAVLVHLAATFLHEPLRLTRPMPNPNGYENFGSA